VNGKQKGVEYALDHMCDSLNSVVTGISEWLYDGWSHSYPAGHRHCRCADQGHSGAKTRLEKRILNIEKNFLHHYLYDVPANTEQRRVCKSVVR
jgi:hypothetical protein